MKTWTGMASNWFFPSDQGQGLDPAMEQNLRAQLKTLAGQPWSPKNAAQGAVLDELLAKADPQP